MKTAGDHAHGLIKQLGTEGATAEVCRAAHIFNHAVDRGCYGDTLHAVGDNLELSETWIKLMVIGTQLVLEKLVEGESDAETPSAV